MGAILRYGLLCSTTILRLSHCEMFAVYLSQLTTFCKSSTATLEKTLSKAPTAELPAFVHYCMMPTTFGDPSNYFA